MKMRIDKERKAYLRKELKEFEKNNPMTDDERKALREWVNEGNSVYENSMMAVGYNYLEEYRDEKYIRKSTIGMSSEERVKFAYNYYGWSYEPSRKSDGPSWEEELIKLGY